MIKTILKKTISITLVFSSISFFSILKWIYSPLNPVEPKELKIGFPSPYYEQFLLKNSIHHVWILKNLLIDFVLVLISVLIIDFFYKKSRKA